MATDEYTYPNGNPERDEAMAIATQLRGSSRVMSDALDEVRGIVCGDRNIQYGPPEINHGRTAALWSTYLGVPITPRQVCLCMVLQKISRDVNMGKHDNLVDICGFVANAVACEAAADINGT